MHEPFLFAIVDEQDPTSIFSHGIDAGDGVFTVRRDPDTRHTQFTVHETPEDALALAARLTSSYPITLKLHWYDVIDPLIEAEIEELERREAQNLPTED